MRAKLYRMLEGGGRAGFFYDRFLPVCVLLSIVPLCFKETTPLLLWLDRVTVSIFILDYLLRWWVADLRCPQMGKAAFLRYPFTRFAVVDLLAILPSLTALHSGFKLLRLFRLGRILRVLKLLRYSKSFDRIVTVIKKERKAFLAVCILAGSYILLTAVIMFQVEPDSFDTFFDAIYWAVVTLTTVGYGDIYPTSVTGKVISMLSALMGVAIIALPTGIITAGYMKELEEES